MKQTLKKCYPSARDGAVASTRCAVTPQTLSESYKLAFADPELLLRDDFRAVRLQLELMKPEVILQEQGVEATVVVFGGARVVDEEAARLLLQEAQRDAKREPLNPEAENRVARARRIMSKTKYYSEALRLGRLVADSCNSPACNFVIATGGGPGIMEAANRGAFEAGAKSVGLNIVLPHEQAPNPYITPELCFQFHYFAMRKMHFLIRAKALLAFPGGYGTMDELFETLTLIQTKKISPLPVILFCEDFWHKAVNFDFLVEEGVIAPQDREIFHCVETAEEAWKIIEDFYGDENNASQGG